MNPLTRHTREQGMSYIEHWLLAMGIAWRLFNSVIAFSLHAMFPFIDIEHRLNLEVTMDFLAERNRQIEDSKQQKLQRIDPVFGGSPKRSVREPLNKFARTG